jgi:hypothetical protein
MQLANLPGNVVKLIKANSPEILTAIGVTGVATTGYLAAKATYKMARDEDADPNATTKEKAKKYWKLYIPTAIAGSLTITCIVGGSRAQAKRTAAAVAAYSVIEKGFEEYKEKVVEQIGKGKEQKVRDEVAQDRVTKTPPSAEVLVVHGTTVLCCELYTGRYFRSDMETLKRAQNEINYRARHHDMYVMLSEFYDIIGLEHTSNSDYMGWDMHRDFELRFSATLTQGGEPCMAFDYNYIKPLR